MKKTALSLVLFLGFAGFVSAQTVNLPGRTIDVNQSGSGGSANIDYGAGAEVNASQNTNTGTSQVNTPGRSTTITPTSVQTTVGGSAGVRVNVGQREVRVSTEADLGEYREVVVNECRGITSIDSSESTVRVHYRQPARLFGIFSTNLSGTIEVDSSKRVSINLPWYSFLFTKDSNSIKTSAESAVVNVGSTSLNVTTQATVISILTAVISSETDGCKTVSVDTQNNRPAATPSNAPTPKPAPAQAPTQQQGSGSTGATGITRFVGDWNGTWTPNASLPAECKPGGAASLSVSSNGTIVGYATIQGDNWPGTGKVDASGNITGSWNYGGTNLNFSGKMDFSTNKATGSYGNNYGCFGTFSLSR